MVFVSNVHLNKIKCFLRSKKFSAILRKTNITSLWLKLKDEFVEFLGTKRMKLLTKHCQMSIMNHPWIHKYSNNRTFLQSQRNRFVSIFFFVVVISFFLWQSRACNFVWIENDWIVSVFKKAQHWTDCFGRNKKKFQASSSREAYLNFKSKIGK